MLFDRNSNTLATWCEELTHLKRPWCWERLRAGGEGDDRRWDGWMASLTQWTWVWVSSGDGEGQGSLACCSLWGCRESDMTEWLNNNFSKWVTQTIGKLCQHEHSLTTLFILIERRSWKKPIGHDASTWQNLGGTERYVYEVLATWRLLDIMLGEKLCYTHCR